MLSPPRHAPTSTSSDPSSLPNRSKHHDNSLLKSSFSFDSGRPTVASGYSFDFDPLTGRKEGTLVRATRPSSTASVRSSLGTSNGSKASSPVALNGTSAHGSRSRISSARQQPSPSNGIRSRALPVDAALFKPEWPVVADELRNITPQQLAEARQKLHGRLSSLRLEEKEVEDDGNCQFRALAHQMYHDENLHLEVRQAALRQLKVNKALYRSFFAGSDELRAYRTKMSNDKEWGDEVTLKAVADFFCVTINVITSTPDENPACWMLKYVPTSSTPPPAQRELWLSYLAPVHYNSLVSAKARSHSRRVSSSSESARSSRHRAQSSNPFPPSDPVYDLQKSSSSSPSTRASSQSSSKRPNPALSLYTELPFDVRSKSRTNSRVHSSRSSGLPSSTTGSTKGSRNPTVRAG